MTEPGPWLPPTASQPEAYQRARQLIDAAHARDPKRTPQGEAAELAYADAMEAWLLRLWSQAPELLRLAVRCQHLERWSVPRTQFPEGRTGYLQWRKLLYGKQAGRARELLLEAGLAHDEAEAVALWVSKTNLATNPGTQFLEDCAVLVFLQGEIASFVADHHDYPEEKFTNILQNTWKKLSPAGREAALSLPLPDDVARLIKAALTGGTTEA